MSDTRTDPSKVHQYEEVLRRFASGVRAGQLYAKEHPLLARNVDGLLETLKTLLTAAPSLTLRNTASHPPCASAGNDSAIVTPGARSASALGRVRFQTVSANPAFARFAAIGPPMVPSPT